MTKSPKVYLRNTGMLHVLHGLPHWEQLHLHPIYEHSWESFVMEQVRAGQPLGWDMGLWSPFLSKPYQHWMKERKSRAFKSFLLSPDL